MKISHHEGDGMAIGIGIAVVVLLAAAIAFVAMRPTNFRIERSAEIDAPADTVFAIINNLHEYVKNNFVAKAMSVFMDMDKMVGSDFEQGLANLNRVASAETQAVRSA